MRRKNKKNPSANGQRKNNREKKPGLFVLPEESKKLILGFTIFIIALIIVLSFSDRAGVAGKAIFNGLVFLIGKAVYIVPLILALGGFAFLSTHYKKYIGPSLLAIIILILGVVGIIDALYPNLKQAGLLGYLICWPFLKLFGPLVAKIVFGAVILVGCFIFWNLIRGPVVKGSEKQKGKEVEEEKEKKPSIVSKFFSAIEPDFKVKEVEPKIKEMPKIEPGERVVELKLKKMPQKTSLSQYKLPPIDLLETDKGKPTAGDTVTNSAIIKKTLENFGLRVEMSGINIGPTVTQYTLKPAEGIKLSKITGLSNNLSLALSAHPIRIEAPIPGKPLVGIEIPNKERCKVRLRDLIASPYFKNYSTGLAIVLGKDVSGQPCYADLTRMPHLLVAGATGTGKTIFLNNLILSLLYQNSPETLRIILIDPKRVEFSAYKDIPHLLAPVIFDAQKAINALKWLVCEMEKRFEILSSNGSRDITSFNEKVAAKGEMPLPYIVLIVDELADLMVARGREVEVGIVRLAQMARAVGIHLVVATQRPSVEVITGLIKANITSRVTFQVASQVDSRTVLDMAGAEKLLGLGDLLFLSAEVTKPRRVQGAYVSEKEVKKVVDYIKEENDHLKEVYSTEAEGEMEQGAFQNHLAEDLERSLETGEVSGADKFGEGGGEDDPLYEEAKKTVLEARKASASLLQRRLRVGYARAARLLDMLEEKGVVGPGEGAKPREILMSGGLDTSNIPVSPQEEESGSEEESEDDGWKKV